MSEQILARGGSIQQNTGLQRLLTYQEAADILAVKPQTLRQWVCYKKIPFVKIGSAFLLNPLSDRQMQFLVALGLDERVFLDKCMKCVPQCRGKPDD